MFCEIRNDSRIGPVRVNWILFKADDATKSPNFRKTLKT